jgi:hypothetical protein
MYDELPQYWKTGSGEKLLIKEMKTEHLIASVKYLRRRGAALILSQDGSKKTVRVKLSSYTLFLKAFKKALSSRKESKEFVQSNPGLFGDFLIKRPKVTWEINRIRSGIDENDCVRRRTRLNDGRIRILTGSDDAQAESSRWDS